MKVTIAIDSFKGSLESSQAGEAVARGIKRVYGDAETIVSPLADGGEGTLDAIISATRGRIKKITVRDPLGRSVETRYGIIDKSHTAVIEMACAAGLTLLSESERNPLYTSTYGVGEMILDAIGEGCREFIVGIGGSATNDGGVGMLSALGVEFLDKRGEPIKPCAIGLSALAEIRTEKLPRELLDCHFSVACDVKNPLCGERGCSAVYGPQKGATPEMTEDMDKWLRGYAELTKSIRPEADPERDGCGAAGGLGFAFLSYLRSELLSGIDIVIRATELEAHIKDSDVVITGEGRLDGQSLMGKAPIGVARLAKKYQKRVIAFAGGVTDDAFLCHEHGIDALFPIVRAPISLEKAMDRATAEKNLENTAEEVFRLIKAYEK